MSLLQVQHLTHTYGGNTPFIHDAVSDVSFTTEKGEIIGIIGHTGSGKSTLVQHLNGLLKPTQGKVLLEEKDIWQDPKKIRSVRSRVGLVFQYPEYQLFEETVYADIAFGPKNMGLSGSELDARIREICSLLSIGEEYLEKSPFDLSGGEKRRVAIAGVMAMRPEIIVFDEPVAGLDPQGRANVVEMIRQYRNAYGATVIIISHNMEDMAVLADKLLVMNGGSCAMFDTTERVFSRAEELKAMGLSVPMVTEVIFALKRRGVKLPDNIFTVDDAVKCITSLFKGGSANA